MKASLFFGLFLFLVLPQKTFASATVVHNLREFATEQSMYNAELDASAIEKVNKLVPILRRRFCNLAIRPDAVAVTVGLVVIEWSIDRLCSQQVEEILAREGQNL